LTKTDSKEAKASRGSGALPAAADVILELRRAKADDPQNRQRLLNGYGRWANVLEEVVIELAPDGSGYSAHGDRVQAEKENTLEIVLNLLPPQAPGLTTDQILDGWPKEPRPRRALLLSLLREAVGKTLERGGTGRKGNPYRYWRCKKSGSHVAGTEC
jgi:hypothetical protein